jgi:uncharacterized protein YjiS (DUF1127 family)
MIANHVILSASMSTYFSDASPYTPRRCHGPPTRHYQSNSWLRLSNKLLRWSERRRRRAAFRDLADEPHLLDDIGLSRQEAMDEANKPFWQ